MHLDPTLHQPAHCAFFTIILCFPKPCIFLKYSFKVGGAGRQSYEGDAHFSHAHVNPPSKRVQVHHLGGHVVNPPPEQMHLCSKSFIKIVLASSFLHTFYQNRHLLSPFLPLVKHPNCFYFQRQSTTTGDYGLSVDEMLEHNSAVAK